MPEDPVLNKFKLPVEVRASMEKLQPDMQQAEMALDVMEKLGMDVSELRSKLDWARNIRQTMLSEFD